MATSRIAKIGNKFYDLGTPNKSFLQVAKDLKTLGIRNFYFMLEIYDYSLINVDPHACDKDGNCTLSKDQVSRIINECARNPWYFIREVCRIPDQGGTSVSYKANRGNVAQAWCIWKGLDSWLCLPRQQGKTISAIAFQVWMYLFGTTNSQFIFVNKDGDNAKTNLKRMLDQIDLLPEYMRCESILVEDGKRVKAKKNATELGNPINNNSVIIKPKATSYDSALSLARGLTAPVLHFDEPEFTNHIKTIVSNSVSTFETAAANAKRNNAMYGRIFTCTPGDLDTKMGMEAQEILDKTADWTEKLYDYTDDEIESYIEAQGEDCNKILYIEYSYIQIGKTEKWLKDISAKIGDPLTVRREILLQRLHGSSLSPFPQEDIEYIVETEHKPIDELWLLDYYKFDIYKQLDRNIPYLVGIDCATGTNGDNNAITIINPYTLEPDAEFECSYIGETMYENLIKELVKVIPKAVIIIERNSIGDGIVDHLLHSPIAPRLYFDKAKDLVEEKARENQTVESMLKKQGELKTYYGVYTGKQSREDMMTILARHVNEYKEKFVAHNVIRDLSRLVRLPSGKIAAGDGFHDDSIMSYLIALYVYYHGNNLAVFGINKGAMDETQLNKGLKRADEINPELVSRKLIEEAQNQEIKEQQTKELTEWETMMKNAIFQSQKETYKLYQGNYIENTAFNNTPEALMDSYDDEGNIPLDFFSEINGF